MNNEMDYKPSLVENIMDTITGGYFRKKISKLKQKNKQLELDKKNLQQEITNLKEENLNLRRRDWKIINQNTELEVSIYAEKKEKEALLKEINKNKGKDANVLNVEK